MNAIGIRVSPRAVTYVIYDGAAREIVSVDTIGVPKALTAPEALKYVRNTILDVIREYDVEKAGIRITESNAQRPSHERIQLEGVIQEAFASSTVSNYYCGQISAISARLGIPRTDFKKYISNEMDFKAVANWTTHGPDEKEAILTAIGAMNA